ncbi:NIPSNAP family protein [Occallatibacter riparius]|uniref:NIPSNAP family protein n=1 Tax=Occallatibacter riparius TaxID=1002689 RepID=A0A9J7BLB3_9BACT|nr:NIPSNAP family protein [Occallatibacter riparius]UWZ83676.1 NIPSNAP family protein [Occallatibacter riparius]
MDRRNFLAGSLAASAVALGQKANAQAAAPQGREFYLLRRYFLENGPQSGLTEHYIGDALIPALARRNMGPVGAFKLDIGPETPTYYVLIPSKSVEDLATLDFALAKDDAFMKAAQPFWSAPATASAFVRSDSTLLAAFEGFPRVTPPPKTAGAKRVYQLRTYESPSFSDHVRKVEMFNAGEFDLFKAAGFNNVFFGDTLVGARMPSLTYMLSFEDLAQLNAHWAAFSNNPEWKKLSSDQKYAFEPIVSNISNLILSPLSSSQI